MTEKKEKIKNITKRHLSLSPSSFFVIDEGGEEKKKRERVEIFLFFSCSTKERFFYSVSISISRTVREYIKRMWRRFMRLHHKHW